MPEKILNYKGHSIYYRMIGSGKPVVFIHGFGEDGNVWKRQVEFLKEKFLLIVPDLPGSGRSEMIDDMSVDGMAEVIKEILIQEKISSCTMIGHSMGGYITLSYVEKYTSSLNAFGLFHSTSYADSEEKKAARRKGIEFIKQHGAFEFLKTTSPNLFSSISAGKMKNTIDSFINGLDHFTPNALTAYYEAMMQRPDRSSLLGKSKISILFVMGQYDNAVPLNDSLQQCHLPQKSFIHILSGSGHMGMMEEPDKSNAILENFLNSI